MRLHFASLNEKCEFSYAEVLSERLPLSVERSWMGNSLMDDDQSGHRTPSLALYASKSYLSKSVLIKAGTTRVLVLLKIAKHSCIIKSPGGWYDWFHRSYAFKKLNEWTYYNLLLALMDAVFWWYRAVQHNIYSYHRKNALGSIRLIWFRRRGILVCFEVH